MKKKRFYLYAEEIGADDLVGYHKEPGPFIERTNTHVLFLYLIMYIIPIPKDNSHLWHIQIFFFFHSPRFRLYEDSAPTVGNRMLRFFS